MDKVERSLVSIGAFCMSRAGTKCGRWNPTAEQLKVLTDLFQSGLRTPSTDQIQMISAHLSSFGKIESKNVFYWFQNHKARERHHKKRRRGMREDREVDHQKARSKCLDMSCVKGAQQLMTREQHDRDIETLELFPLKSYCYFELDKFRSMRSEQCKERVLLDTETDPPVDLRL